MFEGQKPLEVLKVVALLRQPATPDFVRVFFGKVKASLLIHRSC